MSGHRIDSYFREYKLAIEINENGNSNRNIEYKVKRQKAINQELGCRFLWIDPDKEYFDIFRTINETFRHIKPSSNQLTK